MVTWQKVDAGSENDAVPDVAVIVDDDDTGESPIS